MKSKVLGFALLSLAAIVAAVPAQAQNGTLTRSFVSSSGVDGNPCTITQPCASFAEAYTKVSANGIIAALDPGKYGPLAITGPVTVNGNGWAAITGPAGEAAISVNVASGNVSLIGIEIDGAGAGAHGIYLTSALTGNSAITIQNCVVSNFLDSGIAIQPTTISDVVLGLQVFISNTNSFNNKITGIRIVPNTGGAAEPYGTITGSNVANNGNDGFDIEGFSQITIANSVASANTNDGVYVNVQSEMYFVMRDTTASGSGNADFYSGGGQNAYLFHNTLPIVSGAGSSTVYSDGANNIMFGNLVPTKIGSL